MLDIAWIIFIPPLVALLINALVGRRLGKPAAGWLASLAVLLSFLAAVAIMVGLLGLPEEERSVEIVLWQWITIGTFSPDFALLLDPLSAVMALVVTGVGFLIYVYSIEYMKVDDEHAELDRRRYARYFVFVNLFIVLMLVLVLANNFALLYLGWEGVGLCSFLLIGFWFHKPSAADAGKKAFLVNRVGDFGLAVAIFLIFRNLGDVAGSLTYGDVFAAVAANPAAIAGIAVAVTLLLLLAATGKSAQIPLWVWLPDAMEGPTPVSALIHAATMVTAGVYMVARTSPLFELAETLDVVAWIGLLTALMAATIALTKTDLKRILAYSTISQLGFMFLALGVMAYELAIFHLMTHAFFKALLFLGAGSVMHALHGELDINKMGGLRSKMRSTYWTFLIGAAALAGFPLMAGFWSKDAILFGAFEAGRWQDYLLYGLGLFTAFLTAVYSFKMVFMVFWGQPRDRKLFDHAHESKALMTIPLWILALLSIFGGLVNVPIVLPALNGWLEAVLGRGEEHHASLALEGGLLVVSALVSLAGIWLAYRAYAKQSDLNVRLRGQLGFLHRIAAAGYGFDWAYEEIVRKPLWELACFLSDAVDGGLIDGAVNGVGAAFGWAGGQARRWQNGLVGTYALTLFLGVVALVAYFLIVTLVGS